MRIKEVGVFNKGFTTVTFATHKEALIFEKRPYPIEIMGHNITISRTAFPVIRTPYDIVVDGFHLEDKEEIINLVQREGGPIRLIEFLPRMSKVSAIITLARFTDANKLVKMRSTPLVKDHSNVELNITFEWGKDVNTRKDRKADTKSNTNSVEKGESLALSLRSKLDDLDKWRREDKKVTELAMRTMKEKRRKERKEDKIAMFQIMADFQERIISLVSVAMSAAADKQASVSKLTGAISDLRQARLIVNMQITKLEGKAKDEARVKVVEELKKQRDTIEEEIKTTDARLDGILNTKITLPPIPKPSVKLLENTSSNVNGRQIKVIKDNNKRKSESRLIAPNKKALEDYTLALKGKEEHIEDIALTCWNTLTAELEGFLTFDRDEVTSFCEESTDDSMRTEIIARFNSFITVFRKAKCTTKAINFVNQAEGEFSIRANNNKRSKK